MSTVSQPTAVSTAAIVAPVRVLEPTRKRWTREEYYRLGEQGWFQDQRVELIDGDIILLSPQSPQHVVGSERVRRVLDKAFGGEFYVRHQGPMVKGDYSEPEPDVSVVRGALEDYNASHPTTSLLTVEVSRSSLRFDKQTKSHLYASMGIEEYWILDLNNRQLIVHRDPKPDASVPFGYAYASVTAIGDAGGVSPLAKPEATLAVAEMLPPK